MAKIRKMCFDMVLPQDQRREMRVQPAGPDGPARAIALKDKRWVNGSTIRIRFMGGTKAQQDMVRDIAPQWTKFANLEFEFTDAPNAECRVTFDPNLGAWSYVGTDNLGIPLHAATLNLGWQDEGVILHEFGHMIGLSHEHQNPEGGIEWNEPVVIRELAGPPNFWDEDKVRHNVLNKYSVNQLVGTTFDPDSIMLYFFPEEWTLNGVETKANEKLSATDTDFVKSSDMYPPAPPAGDRATKLAVAHAFEAEIGAAGEEDLYKFGVDKSGRYTLTTLGQSDLVMSLYGPNSETNLIAEDDDSGEGRNARITTALSPGEYFVQVRHYSDVRTGDYRILVAR